MFTKRFRDNGKGLLIWSLLLVLMFALVFIVYDGLMQQAGGTLNQLLEAIPPDLLRAFNMTDLSRPSGWIASEGMILLLLCGAIYSAALGCSCVYQERKEGTIEFLAAKPVTRAQILGRKALADLCCILIFTLACSAAILLGLFFSDDLELSVMAQVTLSPILVFLVFYGLALLLSILFRGGQAVSLGVPAGLYMLVLLSKLSEKAEFLQYCTPYALSDTVAILEKGSLSAIVWVLGSAIFGVLLCGSFFLYEKKESL